MKYSCVVDGIFVERPNRFIANVLIDGKMEVAHVKNTGRCKELLYEGVKVYLVDYGQEFKPRKTRYSLISVEKNIKGSENEIQIVNIDSQAPNKIVGEALALGKIVLPGAFGNLAMIKPESTFLESRFDFYVENTNGDKAYIEVKGVTLEDDGVVRFPDAPTERGVKHVKGLCAAVNMGYSAYVIFVIQMKNAKHFEPNDETHPEFGKALREAEKSGVKVMAYDCKVSKTGIEINKDVAVKL